MPQGVLKSARLKILAWVLVPVIMVLGLTLATTWSMLTSEKQAEIDGHLSREASELELLSRDGIDPLTDQAFTTAQGLLGLYIMQTIPDPNETMFVVVERIVVSRTSDSPVDRLDQNPEFLALVNSTTETKLANFQSSAGNIRYLVVPVVTDSDSGALVAVIFSDVAFQGVNQVLYRLALIVILALLAAAAVGWFVAGRVLRPISQLREAAHLINESDLSRRIDSFKSGSEFVELASEFNAMLDRLQDSFSVQKQFVDDAGHELRTPLTVISGHFDLIAADPSQKESSMAIIKDELARMSRMVQDLQTLTRSNQPGFILKKKHDLSQLADALLVKTSALGDRLYSQGHVESGDWNLDEQRITQAVLQLAANSLRHTQPFEAIQISISQVGQELEIAVADAGPGIPKDQRERLLDRFARGSESGRIDEGAGLGLAVVKAIAVGHGGRVEISESEFGGARVALLIPR